ncbi:MAG: hypothetical protein HC908_13180 [Calothrix sp. SM1_7_51]|nr:hypothetical protein [Calothrix sp. SM1_7_51]
MTLDTKFQWALNQAQARQAKLKSYTGLAYSQIRKVSGVDDNVTQAILCEAETPYAGGGDAEKGENLAGTPVIDATGAKTPDCTGLTPKQKQIK